MAISPPSDIVLDVMRAADPASVQAARAALTARTGSANATSEPFSVANHRAGETSSPAGSKTPAPESFKRFEAMVLQTFIQNMLPRDGSSVYGKGLAGDMWKSLLAEKVADSIAERGGIGIADRVLGNQYVHADKIQPLVVLPAALNDSGADGPARLSPALIEDMLRRLNESLVHDFSDSAPSTNERG